MEKYYHSKNPIENLSIRVTLRKLIDGDHENSSKKTVSRVFKWQQKVFGPSEYWKYTKKKDGHLTDILHKKVARKRIEVEYKELIQNGYEFDKNDGVVLYSYTDKDDYVPQEALEKRNTTSEDGMSELGKQVVNMPKLGMQSKFSTGMTGHVAREGKCKMMYLMASVENCKEQYEKKGHVEFHEHTLCTIKYYNSKMVSVCPGFSSVLDSRNDPLAWKKGPKLSTYQFYSPAGSLYEYAIENENEIYPEDTDLLQEAENAEMQYDVQQVEQWRHRCGFQVFDVPDDGFDARLILHIEIVSAKHFDGQYIYMKYSLDLDHQGWKVDGQVNVSGTTQTCMAASETIDGSGASMVHFGFPIELNLLHQMHSNPCWRQNGPRINLQIFSTDAWGRIVLEGYATMALPIVPGYHDTTITSWKPVDTIRNRMKDYFIGNEHRTIDSEMLKPSSDFLTRYGLQTESSGSVRIRVVSMEQKHLPKVEEENHIPGKAVKRDVHQILNSLKGSKTRELKAVSLRGFRPKTPSSSSDNVSSILASLKSRRNSQANSEQKE